MSQNAPLLYSVKEAATKIGVSTWTMYELIKRGAIEARDRDGRIAIEATVLEGYVKALPLHVGDQASA